MPLRRKLILLISLLGVLVIAGSSVVSALGLRTSLVGQLDDRLDVVAGRALQDANFPGPDGGPPQPPQGQPDGPLGGPGQELGTIWVQQVDGEVSSGTVSDDFEVVELTPAQQDMVLAAAAQTVAGTAQDGAGDTRAAPSAPKVSATLPDLGRYRLAVQRRGDDVAVVGLPLEQLDAAVAAFVTRQALVGLTGVLLIALLGAWLIRRALRPLQEVAATARAVAATPLDRGEVRLDQRVAHEDPVTEVGQVGGALNTLLGHVETSLEARQRSEEQVRQFVADASHELRTPLASISGYTELLRTRHVQASEEAGHALARIASESTRMTALVEDLLLLARLDAGRPLDSGDVELPVLVADGVNDAAVSAPDHRWRLDLPVDDQGELDVDGLAVDGDEPRLRQVVANLLRNAAVHTPPGTTTTIGLRSEPGWAVLTVRDDGPGIPATVVPTLFDRFVRADASRHRSSGSTGLGLAIVKAVVEAHGGTIEVQTAAGEGAAFIVRLPR